MSLSRKKVTVTRSRLLYKLRPGDIVLVAVLLGVCAAGVSAVPRDRLETRVRRSAEVYFNGKLYRAVPLSAETTFSGKFGMYTLTFEASCGKFRVKASDCPAGNCMARGWISRPSELIICMPAHVAVRIEGEGCGDEPDAISE